MEYGLKRSQRLVLRILVIVSLLLMASGFTYGQRGSVEAQRTEAIELIEQNRYIDALPILEQIVLSYPDDAELWAYFGIAIIVNSTTKRDVNIRKEEHSRGIKALLRAKQLGTQNARALELLDQLEDFDGVDNFTDENPEVEEALREGELFFGRGDFENAFKSYERAYKLDPNKYEAVLFMGDSLYAQKNYAASEVWFAKAVELNPNGEMAYRFWGDALMNQEKRSEARDKFIEALISDPNSRLPWESLREWSQSTEINFAPIEIIPPGGDLFGVLNINENLLNTDDGTMLWKIYKTAVSNKSTVTFAEETAALRKLADAVRKDLKAGSIRYPDPALVNLIRIDDEGFLEAYILLMRPRENFGDDYASYRELNRGKLRNFIVKCFF